MNSPLLALFTLLLLLIIGVLAGVGVYKVIAYYATPPPPIADTMPCNLPCKCAPLYNLGTDAWIECMQVGRK